MSIKERSVLVVGGHTVDAWFVKSEVTQPGTTIEDINSDQQIFRSSFNVPTFVSKIKLDEDGNRVFVDRWFKKPDGDGYQKIPAVLHLDNPDESKEIGKLLGSYPKDVMEKGCGPVGIGKIYTVED